jgi:hypothetical protein
MSCIVNQLQQPQQRLHVHDTSIANRFRYSGELLPLADHALLIILALIAYASWYVARCFLHVTG